MSFAPSMTSGVAAAILNGGKARRMQAQDKSRLVITGRSILERQLAVLRERFAQIAMVGGQHIPPDLVRLVDRVGGKGPLDGIAAALAWSPEPWVLALASDMPFVVPELVDLLVQARDEEADIVGTIIAGRAQPLLALYHVRLLPLLDSRLAAGQLHASALFVDPPVDLKLRLLGADALRAVDPDLRSFRNLNTPEDVLTSAALIE